MINLNEFEDFVNQLDEPKWFKQLRLDSFKKIAVMDMPPYRYGSNIMIRPEGFDIEKIEPKLLKKDQVKMYCKEPSKIEASLCINRQEIQEFLERSWEDGNKIFFMNQAFCNSVIFIKIKLKAELANPVEIALDVTEDPSISEIFILAEENSKAKIIIHKMGTSKGYSSDDIRVIARQNSRIEVITINELNKDVTAFQRRKAKASKDSFVNWTDICVGSKYVKSDVITELNGNGASTTNLVLFSGSQNQQYDIYTASIHNSPDTFSDIKTKGILNDNAKALSRGLVKIGKEAYNSNGYEKQDVLLMSDKAEADAIPNLEIDNHDVKCSHGSTIGQIDPDKLFYLMSRGLNENCAKQKIAEGYFAPILDQFEDEIRERLTSLVISSMP